MAMKYVHELFPEKINGKIDSDNIIEVFDCYDYRYGNIFYKGKLVYNFYKEMYTDALKDYELVAELQEKGLDIKKAEVIIYSLEDLRDYPGNFTTMDFECAIDYSYKELFKAFQTDLVEINNAIDESEKDRYYKFIKVEKI